MTAAHSGRRAQLYFNAVDALMPRCFLCNV